MLQLQGKNLASARRVFAMLRDQPGASRAALAKATGLSAVTVGKVADMLLGAGLVAETEAREEVAEGTLGRPSRPLTLEDRHPRFLAVQIGVRHTRVAALPVAGPREEDWPVTFATPSRQGAFVERLRGAIGKLGVAEAWAATVSVPGVVDEPAGRVLLCPNIPWLHDADLRGMFRGVVGELPVCFVQEIRALALGHLWAEPEPASFLLVDVGEGVGGAVVVNRELYVPPLPLAGELGHSRVVGNSRRCGCGAVGCLETLASRGGLLATFGQAGGQAEARWEDLVAAAEQGALIEALAGTFDAAGAAIGAALNLVGVRHVVVTGALAELGPAALERLRRAVNASALWARFGQVTVEAAPRRRAAGLVHAVLDRVVLPE